MNATAILKRELKPAETCIKPSKVGGRRFSKGERKKYNSPDPEECVTPSMLKQKTGSEDCLDRDLHTRLAQTRADRSKERDKRKLERLKASAVSAQERAAKRAASATRQREREVEATPFAPPAKRQRSNPLPSVMPDDLRPGRAMTWGENSLARALPI